MPRLASRNLRILLGTTALALAVATAVAGILEAFAGVPDASAVYLVAVVVSAIVAGTPGAITAAVGSFLAYNVLFTDPRGTLVVDDPGVWLNLVLLLFVGIVVGQLAALQRSRAAEARAREREAMALYRISRGLASRSTSQEGLDRVVGILLEETDASRVWICLGSDDAAERLMADTGDHRAVGIPTLSTQLSRSSGDGPHRWIRVHQQRHGAAAGGPAEVFRVRLQAGEETAGSLWFGRPRGLPPPDAVETHLYAAAADQVGQALAHDRLMEESHAAELARQSDALKSALLESVSHDLRTPLATIRAAAGALHPDNELSRDERVETTEAIDREVAYLDRLVTNLLDLSRIEAGVLRAELDICEIEDLVSGVLGRLRGRLGERPLELDLEAPPVTVDPTFIDEALANVLENVIRHTPAGTAIRISTQEIGTDWVRLTLEDAGPGVPETSIGRLFDKFYRVPGVPRRSRSGTGVGLAVVRGIIEASGGSVAARRSELGGLAIDVDLPRAERPLGPRS